MSENNDEAKGNGTSNVIKISVVVGAVVGAGALYWYVQEQNAKRDAVIEAGHRIIVEKECPTVMGKYVGGSASENLNACICFDKMARDEGMMILFTLGAESNSDWPEILALAKRAKAECP
ncbi:MAG: hypothetical protein JW384_03503 [Nitrosomonadaceae bacterium]|nr:hypothetical protein [Nitrosomonadaceae bacterium]